MEREACVCDHGFEISNLCAETTIIIITYVGTSLVLYCTVLYAQLTIYCSCIRRVHRLSISYEIPGAHIFRLLIREERFSGIF